MWIKKGWGLLVIILSMMWIEAVNAQDQLIPIYFVDYLKSSRVQVIREDFLEIPKDTVVIRNWDDLMKLEAYCEMTHDGVKIVDLLAEEAGMDLAGVLDRIDYFYDHLLRRYPMIETVIQSPTLIKQHPKLEAKYDQLMKQPLGQYEVPKIDPALTKQPVYTVIVPLQQDRGQYITYKVNEKTIGITGRYPYKVTIEEKDLHPGINQLRVICNKSDGSVQVRECYIFTEQQANYSKRLPRYESKWRSVAAKPNYIPVLMYHKVLDQVALDQQSIAVNTKLFEKQMIALLEAGYTPINFKNLQEYLVRNSPLPLKPILITTDDSYLCNYVNIYPILKKYSIQATFFVSTRHIGEMSINEHFTWDDAREMEASGLVDIQSHTYRHLAVDRMGKSEVAYEVNTSFDDIENNLGKRDVKVLAYPEFRHTKEELGWVQALGVDLQVTTLAKGRKSDQTIPTDIKRIHVSNDMSAEQLLKEIKRVAK